MSTDTDRKLFDTANAQINEIADATKALEETQAEQGEQIAQLRSALEGSGPIETSGPTVHLSPEDVDDLAEEIRQRPNAEFKLEEGGEYPYRSELDFTDPDQEHRELSVRAPGSGANIVVASEDVDSFGWFGNTRGGCFDRLSLRNLALVVDPSEGYDAGWGRFWIDERVENANLTIEGRRDYQGEHGGDKFGYHCCMMTSSGVGIHRNIDLPDGDTPVPDWDRDEEGNHKQHAIGISAEAEHIGTNLWLGCHVANWWDNGFYVKDGPGENFLITPRAENCGGANIRIGVGDIVRGGRSVWDLPEPDDAADDYDGLTADEVPNGTCLDADAAGATSVESLTAIRRSGRNDTVRIRTGGQIEYENVRVVNDSPQYAVRVSGEASATAKLEGFHVLDFGHDRTRGAAVGIRRAMTTLEDCTVDSSQAQGNRAAVETDRGAEVTIARGQYKGADTHAFRVHGGTEHLELSGNVKLWDGIHLYENGPSVLGIDGINSFLVDELWPGEAPEDVVGNYYVGLMNKPGPNPDLDTGSSGSGGGSGNW